MPRRHHSPSRARASGLVFFLAHTASGVAGLIYQVTWTRILTLSLGHTTAAASTVVAAVMGGLGAGAIRRGRVAAERIDAISPALH